MKIIALIGLGCFLFLSRIFADSKSVSFEMSACKEIGFFLSFRLDNERKGIPEKWDDLVLVEKMKGGMVKHQLEMAQAINSFALVPDSPMISASPGISRDYSGHRLFLISRVENFTKSSGSGRCAILIKPEEPDSTPIRIFSYFIPEETARLILKTIPDFDPAEQPLAFEDLSPFEEAERQFREMLPGTGNSSLPGVSDQRKGPSPPDPRIRIDGADRNRGVTAIVIVFLTASAALASYYWRRARRNRLAR